jgi:LmbE family N-acetylglucosaminyl deacetylase
VIGLLKAVFARFRPTVVRTLDPLPDGRPADHPDHVASARFADAASAGLPVRAVSYRGYPVTPLPVNLTGPLRRLKRQVFEVYRRHDYRAHGGRRYHAWTERMYERGPLVGVHR